MKTTQQLFTTKTSVVMLRAAVALMAASTVASAAEETKADAPADVTATSAPKAEKANDDDDPAVTALTRPTSVIELGAGYVNRGSYKFGEYNGLQKEGLYAIGNIDIEKRAPYDSNDTTHFRVRGRNLGLDTRELNVDFGKQGRFKVNLGYDELRRNISDTYQTPFLGTGTGTLTLPSTWLKPIVPQVNGANLNYRALSELTSEAPNLAGPPTAAQLDAVRAIRNADVPAFHDYTLQTKRTRYDAGFAYNFGPAWEVTGSFRHEIKDGTKPLSALTGFGAGGDSVVVIPELIDTTTEQYNLGLNYTGEKFFSQIAYYGSVFDNKVKSMTWQDPKNPAVSPSISTAPSNQFHEINFTGGYNFTRNTKLVVSGGYGRNTQNDVFMNPPLFNTETFEAPSASANALVITKSLDLKLTARPVPAWNVAGSLKYNERDNRTPVREFLFYDIDEETNAPATPSPFSSFLGRTDVGNNVNIYNNRPQSKTVNQAKFDTDYRLTKKHTIAAGYEWEKIDRSCNGTWIACSDADTTKEQTLRAEWRAEFSEDISTRVALAHSQRKVNYNENAWLAEVPLANVVGTGATVSVYDYITQNGLTGFGPLLGFPTTPLTGNAAVLTPNNNIVLQRFYGSRNNISEIPGMRRYNLADRNRDKIRTSVNWQATERLSLQGGLDFNRDDYSHSVYGLQEAKDYALNLDGNYLIGEDFSVGVFFNHENQQSKMTSTPSNISNTNPATSVANNVLSGSPCFTSVQAHNGSAKIDPCNQWSEDFRDTTNTLGFELTKKKMFGGKFDLTGNLIFTQAKSDINVSGGTYVNNPRTATAGEPGVFFISAENFSQIKTDIFELGLNGEYRLGKSSAVRMKYSYQNLKSSPDYIYEGMRFGSQTAVIPTNEQVSRYSIHTIGVSYVYRFQ